MSSIRWLSVSRRLLFLCSICARLAQEKFLSKRGEEEEMGGGGEVDLAVAGRGLGEIG